jgi:diguanylate cyclase (GGDEF)-like protein
LKDPGEKAVKAGIMALIEQEDGASRLFYTGQVAEIERSKGKAGRVFSALLEIFVHLDFEEPEALAHWQRILEHAASMSAKLGRSAGIHLAILDYFMSVNRMLNTPLLIEAHAYRQTERLAMVDGLTGVFNRRYMDLCLRKEFNRCARYRKELSLIMIDLDDFKRLNDERGHAFGDRALKELGRFLRDRVREEDAVCRYGGEEFLIILPETRDDGAYKLAQRMHDDSKAGGFFAEHRITFSAGIAGYPDAGMGSAEVVAAADKALYQAKFAGKDRVVKYSPDRRKFDRYPKTWSIDILSREAPPLRVEPAATLPAACSVRTENISLGGAKIESRTRFDIDDALRLQIKAMDREAQKVSATAKVTWIQRTNQNTFAYGLSFTDLSRDAVTHFTDSFPLGGIGIDERLVSARDPRGA